MTRAHRVDWRALAPFLGAVVAVVVLAVAAAVAPPDPDRLRSSWLFGTLLLICVVGTGLALVGSSLELLYAVCLRDRRPAALRVLPGVGFRAPAPPWTGWTQAAQILGAGALAIVVMTTARRLGGGLVALGWTVVGLWGAIALLYAVPLARGWPSVLFTPDALVLCEPLGTRTIPWRAVSHVQPWPYGRRVTLTIQRPDLATRRGVTYGSPDLSTVRVHPRFLVDAVRFYAAHPEERAGIGTPEGYRRLLVVLRVLPAPDSTGAAR